MRALGLLAIALILAPNTGPAQAQVEEEIGSAGINFTKKSKHRLWFIITYN